VQFNVPRNQIPARWYHPERTPNLISVDDTQELIKQILQGDRQAFAGLVKRYQGSVFAFLWRMGLRRTVIEELAQEAFVRAWTNLGDFQPERAAFSTWLFAISRNLALNEISRAGHRLEIAADEDLDQACVEETPATLLERKRDKARLHVALGELEPAQRCVLALSYLSELSLAEVAAIEGISVGAAKVRLHRARQALRQVLEKRT